MAYESEPPRVPVRPAIDAFELITRDLLGVALGPRHVTEVSGLIHPVHQHLSVYAWEILAIEG